MQELIRYQSSFVSRVLLVSLLFFPNQFALAKTIQHFKNWDNSIITGSLSNDKKWKYYLQTRLSFIDDSAKFQGGLVYLGIGYQRNPDVIFYLMNGWSYRITANGMYRRQDTLRQQMNWDVRHTDNYTISSITRLEEAKRLSQPQWLIRVRERLTARMLFPKWENHSLVIFDEMFFNLTHPAWRNSQSVFQQNQFFIGIGTQLTQNSVLDIGYLNQIILKNTGNEMNNVLYLTLNTQLD